MLACTENTTGEILVLNKECLNKMHGFSQHKTVKFGGTRISQHKAGKILVYSTRVSPVTFTAYSVPRTQISQVGARLETLEEGVLMMSLDHRYSQVGFNFISVQACTD